MKARKIIKGCWIISMLAIIVTGCSDAQVQKTQKTSPSIEKKFNVFRIPYNEFPSSESYAVSVIKITYEGHQYIMFDAIKRLAAVHDPNCPCHGDKVNIPDMPIMQPSTPDTYLGQ